MGREEAHLTVDSLFNNEILLMVVYQVLRRMRRMDYQDPTLTATRASTRPWKELKPLHLPGSNQTNLGLRRSGAGWIENFLNLS